MVSFNTDVPEAERLAKFVANLRRLFIHCEDRQSELFGPHFQQASLEMWPTLRQRTYDLENELTRLQMEERPKLIAAGLAGSELDVKLNGFYLWYQAFNISVVSPERVITARPSRWWKFGRADNAAEHSLKWLAPLKYALKWANITLGSLAAVLPVAEPLKELKEVVERGIEDGEAKELPRTGRIIFPDPEP